MYEKFISMQFEIELFHFIWCVFKCKWMTKYVFSVLERAKNEMDVKIIQ